MDSLLRELERSAAQGDEHARVRLLTERVRAGAVRPRQLELAAFLGDADAIAVSGVPSPQLNLTDGIDELARIWGKEAAVRAGVALASAGLDHRSAMPDRPHPALLRAVRACEAWRLNPVDLPDWRLLEGYRTTALTLVGIDRHLAFLAIGVIEAASAQEPGNVAAHLAEVCNHALRILAEDAATAAVRAALVPWALG